MILVPCELEHIEAIESPDDRFMVVDMLRRVPHGEETLRIHARALLASGTVMACIGVWPIWEHVATAWTMLTPEVLSDHPRALTRHVHRLLSHVEDELDLRRLEATILYGHIAAHLWIKNLGFECEGLMRNYGPGGDRDFYRYARLRCPTLPPSPS